MKRIYLSLFLIILVGIGSAFGQRQVQNAMAIGAGKYIAIPLPIEDSDFNLKAKFRAQGGSGNDVEVYIFDRDGYENWINGHSVPTFYNSGRVTVGTINVNLKPGNYVWVFSNNFSAFTPKAVTLTMIE